MNRPGHTFGLLFAAELLHPLRTLLGNAIALMLNGAKVSNRRKALGLTQQQLADLLGLGEPGQGTISNIERNRKGVTLSFAQRLAWALRCDVSDIL